MNKQKLLLLGLLIISFIGFALATEVQEPSCTTQCPPGYVNPLEVKGCTQCDFPAPKKIKCLKNGEWTTYECEPIPE